ncbi:bifunctional 4-hydroxy-3-methylbut-2-enyl diphosphate reductase/30S ribosomal protein S1 [Desulfitibacter alkalitolerans]|uniref:bifunctional 4-hydroxy-3-methylbut-2-enyl diphosphate reductase/30S ribosomal protein S1 n=1 Tax=Desulfitibacter alkalitolerans TaxID=264641 RepID=UPI00048984FD|nr:bifunctional 4-hydroxy-3-methylbut-2-enyl diphosphate reductase/30S ribosomal protein S1 [Desulfitibacter alkalitolerans]
MEIIVAKEAGFCFGVKRAIELAYNHIEDNNTYSYGPLIHNPQVIADLEAKGVKYVTDISSLKPGTKLIIRSHGAGPQIFEEAQKLDIIDGTCPFVSKAQKIAHNLFKDGYNVVIVGDKNHPEVQGIKDWAQSAYVVANLDEANTLPEMDKVGILAQTTLPEKLFLEIVEFLQGKVRDIKVHNTICRATHLRQLAAKELAPKVDLMVVIGGYNSANTGKLVDLCQKMGTSTIHIEHAHELKADMLNGIKTVGVTAGASTPDWIIEEVVLKMVEFSDEQNKEVQNETVVENAGDAASAVNEKVETQDDVNISSVATFQKGDIITGKVVQVDEEQILVDVGGKSEGIVPKGEISATGDGVDLKPGDEIEVFVIKPENEEGHPILSKRRADRRRAWETIEDAFENNTELTGKAVEVVKGGILVDIGIRGFVPASLVERGYVENLEEYIGKDLRLKIIELDKTKNKVVLSQKAVLDEEFDKQKQETWDNIEVGQVKKGIVRRLTDFGAFVDIGGVDGLLHVSEISWGRVDHPRDVLQENQEVDVIILGVDKNTEKVSLGLKQLQENPWKAAATKYPVGSIVKGNVLRIAPFGAFVEIEPGVEGLVHISQLSNDHVEKTEDVLSVGDEVEVKVLSVDTEAQRMSLSIKDAQPKKPAPQKKKEERKEEYVTTNDGGFTIGDLYGDLLKGNGEKK